MARHDQAAMAADFQEAMDRPPEAPGVRNINHDVHLGFAAQRPYAALEDRMGAVARPGHQSFEELAAALKGVEGEGNQIEQDASGDWVRYVPRVVDTIRNPDGTGYQVVEDVPRYVALTRDDARQRSAGGVETDYFDGFTWWRRGSKPEKDLFVAEQQAVRRNLRRVPLDPTAGIVEARTDRPAARSAADTGGRAAGAKE